MVVLKIVEVVEAKELGYSRLDARGSGRKIHGRSNYSKTFEGISVAGSHGKTTTTAMIATVLKENKLGSVFSNWTGDIPSLGSSGHFGKGKYFVAEADEYATEPKYDKTPKFLWQNPQIGVITNIEFDHPDLYSSMDRLRKAFLDFAKNIKPRELLVACLMIQKQKNY